MKELYEIVLASTDEACIRRRVTNVISNLGLYSSVRWKDDAFFGSIRTEGGIELRESEGRYSLIVYGSKGSQTAEKLTDALAYRTGGLEVKTVKILKDQPDSEKTSKSTAA